MMYAEKIKMQYGCWNSQKPEEISQIYIRGYGWYYKATLYDHLKQNPRSIAVNIWPYPCLIPALSSNREKYVRSSPDIWSHDDLMDLPRE
jgi:hypothetical protein